MSCKWESFNDSEAQKFSSDIDGSYEHQALGVLHFAYLQCAGAFPLESIPEKLCPSRPIDMLCFYQTVAETFRLPATTKLQPSPTMPVPGWVLNMPEAIKFVSTVPSEEAPRILRNFLMVVASNRFVSSAPFDVLFCCKLLSVSACRDDMLEKIRTNQFTEQDRITRNSFEAWVDLWTGDFDPKKNYRPTPKE